MAAVSDTINLERVMETNMEFPSWNPAKETLTENLERLEAENAADIPVDEGPSWDLLEECYGLDNWTNVTNRILGKDAKEFQKKTSRAAMRPARSSS